MVKRRSKGEGSIFYSKKENTWIAEINLPDGTAKRKRSKRQQVVRDWLLDARKSIQTGVLPKNDQITVSQFMDRYFEDVVKLSVRPTTFIANESLLRLHIKPMIGKIKLTQLRPDHLQTLYAEKRKSGLSPRMVQMIHSVIHKALKQALMWGLVTRNVSDLVEKPKVERKTFIVWSLEEVRLFLDAVKDHRFYPIYTLAIAGGLREGEILGLFHEDISWEQNMINIRRAVVTIPGKGSVLIEPKSAKSRRPIPLPDYCMNVLKKHCEGQKENRYFVFTTKNGTPFLARNLIRHFKQVISETKLPNIRFHDLRHYHASYLLSQGVHPKVVQERLGHSQISLTLDTYSHVIPSLQNEAAEKLESIFSEQ